MKQYDEFVPAAVLQLGPYWAVKSIAHAPPPGGSQCSGGFDIPLDHATPCMILSAPQFSVHS